MGHIGDKLKIYRTEKDINQSRMAELLNVGFRTYQDIEKTGIVKKADVLQRINKVIGQYAQNSAHPTSQVNEPEEDYEKLYVSELKDKIRILQEHNSFLARNFEVSLSAIHQTTVAQLAHQKALAWYQASTVAKGDPDRTEKEIVKLNNKVAEYAGVKSEKGNPVRS